MIREIICNSNRLEPITVFLPLPVIYCFDENCRSLILPRGLGLKKNKTENGQDRSTLPA